MTDDLLTNLDAALKGIVTPTTMGTSVLQPEKYDAFIRTLQIQTTILKEARFKKMDNPIVDIDRISFSGRILTGGGALASQAQSAAQNHTSLGYYDNTLSDSNYVAPTTVTNKLVARELQAICGLRDATLRRNMEKGNFEQTLIDLFGEAAGRDLEEWALFSNMSLYPSANFPFLALTNGWLKNAGNKIYGTKGADTGAGISTTVKSSNDVSAGAYTIVTTADPSALTAGQFVRIGTAGSATEEFMTVASSATSGTSITFTTPCQYAHASPAPVVQIDAIPDFNKNASNWVDTMLNEMLGALPKQYLQNTKQWRFYVNWEVYDGYRDILRARNTVLGDSATTGDAPLYFKGIPVVYVSMLERTAAFNGTSHTYGRCAILANPDNMVWGVFHDVTIEPQRFAADRRTDFVLTFEGDCNYEDENGAVVAYIDVPAV
jgi:hypothetical protein